MLTEEKVLFLFHVSVVAHNGQNKTLAVTNAFHVLSLKLQLEFGGAVALFGRCGKKNQW